MIWRPEQFAAHPATGDNNKVALRRIDLLFFGEEKRAVFEQAARPGGPAEFPVRAVLEQDRAPVTVFWAP
mgnify:CR=1 FL=1